MLEIYPKLTSSFSKCPACGCELSSPSSLFFYGAFTLADIECTCCDVEYYHSYPAKDRNDPDSFAFTKDGKHISNKAEFNKGISRILSDSIIKNKSSEAVFDIESRKTSVNVVLINCLYNSDKLIKSALEQAESLYKEKNLIIVIPAKYKHLIVFDVAEIWSVEAKSKNKFYMISGFDRFVKEQCSRFEKVYLSPIDIIEDLRINFSTKLFLYFKNFSNN